MSNPVLDKLYAEIIEQFNDLAMHPVIQNASLLLPLIKIAKNVEKYHNLTSAHICQTK